MHFQQKSDGIIYFEANYKHVTFLITPKHLSLFEYHLKASADLLALVCM